ncbi:MAG: hypothetical protein QOI31_1736 [Solirubrobacterales bacterium]|jgi:hypothetical protein|nr:hypothetical protein [Solirubrobacterales bacterium]
MAKKKGGRKPKATPVSPSAPVPKTPASPVSTSGDTPHFCFRWADRATQEAWAFSPAEDAGELIAFLYEMSQLTWSAIEAQQTGGQQRRRKHHSQEISTLETAAQNDISKRKLDTRFGETMFRFRVAGGKRLWGFRNGRVFHAIWWDPDHAVYPTDPN